MKKPATSTTKKSAASSKKKPIQNPLELEAISEDAIEGMSAEEQQRFIEEILRKTPEYQASWELELWKKNQKRAFLQFMKTKEKEFTDKFEKESKKKLDKERQALQDEKDKLVSHNEKLERSIIELESREKKIKHLERELHQQKASLSKDHERKAEDMRHAIKLAKEECVHKVDMERKRSRTLTDENQTLRNRLNVLTEKYDHLLNDYHELKKNHVESDTSKMQLDINRLKDNLDEANASKKKYKHQAKKLKKELDVQARKHQSTIHDLNHQHNRMLFDIKREFTKLNVAPSSTHSYTDSKSHSTSAPPPTTTEKPSIEEDIKKLIEIEKQKLAAVAPPPPIKEENKAVENECIMETSTSDSCKTPLSEKSLNVPPSKPTITKKKRRGKHSAEKPAVTTPRAPNDELRRLIRDKAKILQSGVYDERSPV
eukprot:CAMPEP_0117425858 /NCGR_PEP_ID=MMETSP0758-20121206/6084_1 /TAXON_ID=63605 /ORGANISM="Percolomonas cosmopolitus, Strain AE-1 (ATCC 50343)" /LENGTH=428 /DNA_ID=CAMNT_0005210671 /DNA_START=29 /DNA_END=1311 /DNA_ORIENTATION=+